VLAEVEGEVMVALDRSPLSPAMAARYPLMQQWMKSGGMTPVKVRELLARQGIAVPQCTMWRYELEVLGVGRSARKTTDSDTVATY
jgi:hypothetical protein